MRNEKIPSDDTWCNSGTRWAGSGKMISEGATTVNSGGGTQKRSVGIMLDHITVKILLAWEPVKDRLTTRLKQDMSREH